MCGASLARLAGGIPSRAGGIMIGRPIDGAGKCRCPQYKNRHMVCSVSVSDVEHGYHGNWPWLSPGVMTTGGDRRHHPRWNSKGLQWGQHIASRVKHTDDRYLKVGDATSKVNSDPLLDWSVSTVPLAPVTWTDPTRVGVGNCLRTKSGCPKLPVDTATKP